MHSGDMHTVVQSSPAELRSRFPSIPQRAMFLEPIAGLIYMPATRNSRSCNITGVDLAKELLQNSETLIAFCTSNPSSVRRPSDTSSTESTIHDRSASSKKDNRFE
jgi:hypothetical protein